MIDLLRDRSPCLDVSDLKTVEEFAASLGATSEEVLAAVGVIGAMPNALRSYFESMDRVKAWPPAQRKHRSESSAAGRKRRREDGL